MSSSRKKQIQRYAAGMGALFLGAWLSDETASMLPLACGAATALMCTFALVTSILGIRR